MISRYNVWLNDISLTETSPALLITDISYQAAAPSLQGSDRAGTDGQYTSTAEFIASNRVSVSFQIREYNTWKRQQAVQDVIRWAAKGGWIETYDRPDQRMYVRCTRLPSVGSVLRWTDTLTVEFTAYDYPFWTDKTPTELTLEEGDTGTLYLTGVRETDLEAVITADDTITELRIYCGNTDVWLKNISVQTGTAIRIGYTDDHHLLTIKAGNVSLLDKRDPTSADDLIAQPGANDVSFTCDEETASCTLMAKGVWL